MQHHRLRAEAKKAYFQPRRFLRAPLPSPTDPPGWYVIAKSGEFPLDGAGTKDSDAYGKAFLMAYRGNPAMAYIGHKEDSLVPDFVDKLDEYMLNEAWLRIVYPDGKYKNFTVWYGDYYEVGSGDVKRFFRKASGGLAIKNAIELPSRWGFSGPTCGMCYQVFESKQQMLDKLTVAIADLMDDPAIVFGQEPRTKPVYDISEKRLTVSIN